MTTIRITNIFMGIRGLILFFCFDSGDRLIFTGKRNVVETPKRREKNLSPRGFRQLLFDCLSFVPYQYNC